MMSGRRVVITGIGAVTPCGWSADDLHRGLLAGATFIRPPHELDATGQRTGLAGEVPPAPDAVREAIASWERLSRSDRFAVAAAVEAVAQAAPGGVDPGAGVFFGSSTGGMLESEEYVGRLLGVRDGRPRIRQLASQQVNGPGDAVARHLRLHGPVQTVSSACSSGALAVGAALQALRESELEMAVAGGSDSLCLLTYSGFNSLRSVDPAACRPFRADREGLSLGEGAGVLVLETLEHALGRGARPLAELLGSGASCDAHHMTAPEPAGQGAAAALEEALADAGVGADRVAFVNAHGTGTPHNDVAEGRALGRVLGAGAHSVPVTTVKGAIGHLLGSAGAVEAVATVLGLVHGVVHPLPAGGEVDAEIDLDVVLGRPRKVKPGAIAVSGSLGFGGANAALVLSAWVDGDDP